jgi:hypothetical protein
MRKVVFSCINFSFGPNYHWVFHPKIQFQHTFASQSWRDRKNGDHLKIGICMRTQIYSAREPIGAFISWTHILSENYQSPNKYFDAELREASMTSFL